MRQKAGSGLQLRAKLGMRPRRAVTHGDQVLAPDKEVGLAIADMVAFQVGGLGDDEQLIAIDVDLWRLAGVQGVLDRQRMQVKRRLQNP